MQNRFPCLWLLMLTTVSSGVLAQTPQFVPRNRQQPMTPPNVTAHRDIPYVENGHERQRLDLFLPAEAKGPLPVIVWIHGGGWKSGSKENCLPLRAHFVEKGYAVASIGYRLSSHAIFPAQIEDCKGAIRWLRAHAEEYHLDPDRFGVWGSSAGGHLAALVGTAGDVKNFDVGAHLDQSSRVQAVCDYYGPSDFTASSGSSGGEAKADPRSSPNRLIGGLLSENPEKAAAISPVTYVSADDPPFLIVHGDKDQTVSLKQSQLLFEALKARQVAVRFHTIHGVGHGGPGFNTPEVIQIVADYFEKTLKSPPGLPSHEAILTESTAPVDVSSEIASPRPRSQGLPIDMILQRQDKDGDGKLSREEFRGPPHLFDRWDSNKDGGLTKEELIMGMANLPPRESR
jgi:acetyl esterase/lipase